VGDPPYRWPKKYADVGKPEARRLRELEKENARLKKLVADLSLDNDIPGERVRRRRSPGERGSWAIPPEPGEAASRRRPRPARVGREPSLRRREGRRACRAVGQPRTTQRYTPERPAKDQALVTRLLDLAREHPRYGYRRAWAVLRGEGWGTAHGPVNRKRVHRLWREAGLQVPQTVRKRRRLTGEHSTTRLAPERPNHVWC
jgi:putative transposase